MLKNKLHFCLILVMGCQGNSEKQENHDTRYNINKEKIYVEGTLYIEAGSRTDEIKFDWIKEEFNTPDKNVKEDEISSKKEGSSY